MSNHYQNQCWFIVNWNSSNKFMSNLNQIAEISFKKMYLKVHVKWRPQCLSSSWCRDLFWWQAPLYLFCLIYGKVPQYYSFSQNAIQLPRMQHHSQNATQNARNLPECNSIISVYITEAACWLAVLQSLLTYKYTHFWWSIKLPRFQICRIFRSHIDGSLH